MAAWMVLLLLVVSPWLPDLRSSPQVTLRHDLYLFCPDQGWFPAFPRDWPGTRLEPQFPGLLSVQLEGDTEVRTFHPSVFKEESCDPINW